MNKKISNKTINIFKYLLISLGFISLLVVLMSFNIKGEAGTPLYYQQELDTKIGGPFESSGSTSRYALVKSIVENKSLLFGIKLAKFASPDVTGINGKYTTLFTPGVSLAAAPFYYLGRFFGLSQLVTYLSTTVFALLNIFLVYLISRKFNVNRAFSVVSGLSFGFATSAMAYANTLTQHHLSVFLILLAVLNAANKRNFINNFTFGLIVGAGLLVDIPNFFMMVPIGLYILSRNFDLEKTGDALKLKVKLSIIALLIGIIPMIGVFGWYNHQTTGSYTKLAQSIGRTDVFASDEIKEINKQTVTKSKDQGPPLVPFDTRMQLNGLYILLFSDERGIFYYNPVVIFGILGLILAVKNKASDNLAIVIISVVMVNILLYSMFGDPWGGWSFGPRYLIPATALLCTGIGYSLSKLGRNPFFSLVFVAVLIYSVGINVLGATTTNLVPPKVEAVNFSKPIPHTYQYNYLLAEENKSGILIYNLFLKNLINVKTFIYFYATAILTVILSFFGTGLIFRERKING